MAISEMAISFLIPLSVVFSVAVTVPSFIGNLSEVYTFIGNGITYLQLLLPQIVIAITLCPYETILD